MEWKICLPLLLFSAQAPVRFTRKTVRFREIQCGRIQVATDGTRPPSTMNRRYQPGGATVPSGGDLPGRGWRRGRSGVSLRIRRAFGLAPGKTAAGHADRDGKKRLGALSVGAIWLLRLVTQFPWKRVGRWLVKIRLDP